MFDRRDKPGAFTRFRDFFWPRAGFRRSGRYIFHRVARLPGTPYSLAAGFACGAAISFTPFVGLHFVLSAILAWLIRANVVASAIGTAVGNPWTFPFIWIFVYNTGVWLGALDGENTAGDIEGLDFAAFFAHLMEAFLQMDGAYIFQTAWPVFWPMLLGSVPIGVVVWFLFYIALKPLIGSYQGRRASRRAKVKSWKPAASEDENAG